jgi:putative DNA primase/helicase
MDKKDPPLQIKADNQNLRVVTGQAWFALEKANNPPYLFRHAGSIVRLEDDEKLGIILRALDPYRTRYELARAAIWYVKGKNDKGDWVRKDAKPPMDVVKDLLATPNYPLPIINRITQVPVFASNGLLQTDPGYHGDARIYYSPVNGLVLPNVPKNPTSQDVGKARHIILNELLFDFPFVSEADRAHAVALFLLPFARDLIPDPTPCHLIEAPTPGTGKGLLADVALRPAVGRHIGVVAQARDGDEWRKRLTACFRELREVILIDNVTATLDSGELASALTALTWTDRILGRSETASQPVRCVWVCTANNPTMSTEIARRCIRIRLDRGIDRPWIMQADFKHSDLRKWVDEHRGELVWSALVLIQAWLASGSPQPKCKQVGSYEEWSRVIGGVLEVAGIEGFLANLDEFYEVSDIEGAIWREFIGEWWKKYGSKTVSVADLFELALYSEGFDLKGNNEKAQRISFGKQLARQRDRVIGGHRILESGKKQHAAQWRLVPLSDQKEGIGSTDM